VDCPGGERCVAGACVPPDRDGDRDGVPDLLDRCPAWAPDEDTPLIDQLDSDGDGLGDVCDPCPQLADPRGPDADGDGLGLGCDLEAEREREPYNDLPARAPELAVGRWLEGVIGPPTPEADQDWAFFRARAGDRVRLEALAWPDTSSLDPLLVVMDRDTQGGAYMRLADDGPAGRGDTRDALLELVMPATGEYLVLVTAAQNWFAPEAPQGDVGSTWRLRLSRHARPTTMLELPQAPFVVQLPAGTLAGFGLQPGGPALLEVGLRGGGLWDPALAVLEAGSGRLLATADNQPACADLRDARLQLCLEGGPVELWVESVGLSGQPPELPAALELRLESSVGCAGGACDAALPAAGGARLLALGEAAAAPLQVEATSAVFSPALELLACAPGAPTPQSLGLAEAGPAGSAAAEALAAPGVRLFARVRERAEDRAGCAPRSGAGRTFALSAAPAAPRPEPLLPGPLHLELEPGRPRWFSLEGLRAVRLRAVARPAAGSAAHPALALRGQGGWPLYARASAVGSDQGAAEIRWSPAADGPIWLRLTEAEGGGGPAYAVELELSADALPAPELEEPPGEHAAPDEAAPLPPGELVLRGALSPAAGEADCFRLESPLGEALELVTWAGAPGEPPDTILLLWDHAGRTLTWNDDQGGSTLAGLPALAGRGQGWTACVEARGADPLAYRLEVRRAPLTPGLAVPPQPGELCLNEALLDPGEADLDGDGRADAGDQYVELLNAGPYPLALQGLVLWAAGGGALFDEQVRLEPGEALLVLNGAPPPPGAFPAQAFGRARTAPWLAAGARGLELALSTPAGASLELGGFALPSTGAPGESVARPADAGCDRPLRPHAALPGAAGPRSPGARLDGSPFPP